ncbi:UMP-CMP kinase 2, mitochondrial [Colossoma macropomum]|uniref:UMP-CMP kinase 2, mitochondrial n=1 Tax=Colossoma macropomum TaxID=42526 RepID=UPI0018649DED|nr:UMP-CMP kinase 2, mitochondrial [Colossoma macropomum]
MFWSRAARLLCLLSFRRSVLFLCNKERHGRVRAECVQSVCRVYGARALRSLLNMSVSRLARGCSRLFLLELEARAEPLCFSLSSERSASTRADAEAVRRAFGSARIFSLLVDGGGGGGRVQRARSHAELMKTLHAQLPPECSFSPLTSFLPGAKDSLIRGFFLRDESASNSTERLLSDFKQSHSLSVFSYERDCDGQYWWCQEMFRSPATEPEAGQNQRFYVTPTTAPEHHPAILNIINSDVFYRLEDAYQVLKECRNIIPESKAVLEIVDQQLEACRQDKGFPVIVLEGLDATGKSTLTESLQKALGATLLKSPPQCLAPYRQRFDSEPPLIRRAFYALGNYITAAQIRRESSQSPVIVDRYWHSTAAYAIATAVSGPVEKLPSQGSEIYEWPSDLLRPSLVLLLTVSPQERLRRLQHRGLGQTEEETQLEVNHLFRQKVDEAYKRIQNPACVVVDASPSPDQVLQQVLRLIRNKCHL